MRDNNTITTKVFPRAFALQDELHNDCRGIDITPTLVLVEPWC